VKNQYALNKRKDEVEIDLVELAKALWANAFVIFLVAILIAAIAFAYSYFLIVPTYEANCKVYVNNSSHSLGPALSISGGDIVASESLIPTYIVILESRTTINEVIRQAKLDYTYTELLEMISVSSIVDTAVFNITVSSTDPAEAKLIANTIANVLPDKVAEIVDGTSVRIVDYAITPPVKAAPSITKNTAIGFVIGFIIACIIFVIRDLIDDVIHDEDALTGNYNLPILGVIPDLDSDGKKDYHGKKTDYQKAYQYYGKFNSTDSVKADASDSSQGAAEAPVISEEAKLKFSGMSFAATEAYKLLRTNVRFVASDKKCKIIGVTSSTKGEGKSTTSINLAYALAEAENKVLLIDGDLRIPTIANRLSINQQQGLSAILAGFSRADELIAKSTIFDKLHVLPAGEIPPNPNELLGTNKMKNLLTALSASYDYIIIDLPPVNIVADALTVSGEVDGMITVVRQDYSSVVEVEEMIGKFNLINIKPLGFVFVDVADRSKGRGNRKYSKYGSKNDRYARYGYSSYYDKKSYPNPKVYAANLRGQKDEK